MANGIEDLSAIPAPNQSPIEMIIEIASPSVTKIANDLGIPVNNEDTKRIAQGIAEGDSGVALDVVNEKLTNLPNEARAQLAGELISKAGMITTPVGQLNAINAVLQSAGDTAQIGLGAGEKGLEYLSDKIDDSKFDFLNIPSTVLDVTGSGLGLTNKGIQGIQAGSGFIAGTANKIIDGIIYNPVGKVVGFAGRNVIDPFFDRFGFNFGRRPIRPKPKPEPPQSFIDRQPPPPIVVTDTQKPYESGVGQNTGQTGGPAGMGFAPPPPQTVGTSGMTYRDVINRADGGLATIPRYLKGR